MLGRRTDAVVMKARFPNLGAFLLAIVAVWLLPATAAASGELSDGARTWPGPKYRVVDASGSLDFTYHGLATDVDSPSACPEPAQCRVDGDLHYSFTGGRGHRSVRPLRGGFSFDTEHARYRVHEEGVFDATDGRRECSYATDRGTMYLITVSIDTLPGPKGPVRRGGQLMARVEWYSPLATPEGDGGRRPACLDAAGEPILTAPTFGGQALREVASTKAAELIPLSTFTRRSAMITLRGHDDMRARGYTDHYGRKIPASTATMAWKLRVKLRRMT